MAVSLALRSYLRNTLIIERLVDDPKAQDALFAADWDLLVVDEAHELADRIRSQGTIALSAAAVAPACSSVAE